MDIKKINTDSLLFKMYAKQLARTTSFMWQRDRVLKRETNICDFGRRVFYQGMLEFFKAIVFTCLGVIVTLMVVVPVMSVGLWWFTDNGWIYVLGELGKMVRAFDLLVLILAAIGGAIYGLSKLITVAGDRVTFTSLPVDWLKDYHNKFCSRIEFEVDDDENNT